MPKQNFRLNTSCHCRSLNQSQTTLCNTVVLGTVSRGELLLIKSSLHTDVNSPPKNSPPLSDLNISTKDRIPSARTLARKLRNAVPASDLFFRIQPCTSREVILHDHGVVFTPYGRTVFPPSQVNKNSAQPFAWSALLFHEQFLS